MKSRPITVGIVANEFLDPAIGRMGGFGWAARRAAEVLDCPSRPGVRPVFLTARLPHLEDRSRPRRSNGTRLLLLGESRMRNMFRLWLESIDVLLTIDYRTSYDAVFDALPLTPVITWVRDPRPPADIEKMMSLVVPGQKAGRPGGIHRNNTTQLATYADRPWPAARTVLLANKMPHMAEKNPPTYGLPPSYRVLPNPSLVDYDQIEVEKSSRPSVVFLGRLDPIKRPWLFVELGRRFPQVDFYMMGQNHFDGPEGWTPERIPENVKLLGHLSGEDKYSLLSSAWILVNTSIHEESPVSVMEALAHEVPVVSFEDWGDLVARHGIAIGQHLGAGWEGMQDLVDAVDLLLTREDERTRLGAAGREYVESEHTDERFFASFEALCREAGVSGALRG